MAEDVKKVVEDEAANAELENVEEEEVNEDALSFNNGVIEKIIALAVRDVDGVVGMKGGWVDNFTEAFGQSNVTKGVSVEVGEDGAVRVNISILIAYGAYAPKVFEEIKSATVDAMNRMTGLEVAGVNLRIEDVLTEEDIAKRAPRRVEAPEDAAALPEAEPETEQASA